MMTVSGQNDQDRRFPLVAVENSIAEWLGLSGNTLTEGGDPIVALYRKLFRKDPEYCRENKFPRMREWFDGKTENDVLNEYIEVALFLLERKNRNPALHYTLNNTVYHFGVNVNIERLQALIKGEEINPGEVLSLQLVVPGEGDTERKRVEVEVVVPKLGRHARPEVHTLRRVLTEKIWREEKPPEPSLLTSSRRTDSKEIKFEKVVHVDKSNVHTLHLKEVTDIFQL